MPDNIDPTLLKQILFYLIGPGAGVVTFWLMDRYAPDGWTSEIKRYVALALAAVLAMGAYAASVGLTYLPQPETVQSWIEALFAVAGVSIGLSQGIHGFARLRNRA